jgi:hypothetical protein
MNSNNGRCQLQKSVDDQWSLSIGEVCQRPLLQTSAIKRNRDKKTTEQMRSEVDFTHTLTLQRWLTLGLRRACFRARAHQLVERSSNAHGRGTHMSNQLRSVCLALLHGAFTTRMMELQQATCISSIETFIQGVSGKLVSVSPCSSKII